MVGSVIGIRLIWLLVGHWSRGLSIWVLRLLPAAVAQLVGIPAALVSTVAFLTRGNCSG